MSAKVRGVASSIAKLRHNLDSRAEKLLARVEQIDQRGATAFDRAHGHLDASEAALGEVDKMVADLEAATNGGPSSDDSGSESSEPREPKDSWSAK